ncbi:DUF5683 domain-containing protein [Neolewinella persica]|uniref:DUF5683 domain-containing protein n=1 Tax=Neolewinella persica TaxID=70998 RepID=UPI000375A0FA|nr:DUF5683 domain-containing protein [Neolewinella persica]
MDITNRNTGFCHAAAGSVVTFIALFILFLAPATAPAQITDTLPPPALESIRADTAVALKEIRRKPRNALLWSAIPGGGQVYNKRWWKVPLVYGGLLGMVAYADFNQTSYTRFTTALENRCLGDGNIIIPPASECVPTEDAFPANQISDNALLQARANADKSRQTAYIGIFVVYLLQAVEAYTDAHLQEFDISDDLSIQLGPIAQPDGMMAAGLTVPLGSGQRLKGEETRVQRLRALAR